MARSTSNDALQMLKASPISNRSVRRTCGIQASANSTLKECPNVQKGDPVRVGVSLRHCPGVLRTPGY
ncbi:MAG: hypothetical protein J5506_10165 [Prevotella sp.]|nr:hypothetical protein [Prevotella sp.]